MAHVSINSIAECDIERGHGWVCTVLPSGEEGGHILFSVLSSYQKNINTCNCCVFFQVQSMVSNTTRFDDSRVNRVNLCMECL